MLDLSSKATGSKSPKLKPGQYTAKVIDIDWAEGYINKSAFKVSYEMVDSKGKSFNYSEIFFANRFNNRTDAFFTHLEANEIFQLGDYVGCTEIVEIGKDVQGNKARLTIYKRTFVSHDDKKEG